MFILWCDRIILRNSIIDEEIILTVSTLSVISLFVVFFFRFTILYEFNVSSLFFLDDNIIERSIMGNFQVSIIYADNEV